ESAEGTYFFAGASLSEIVSKTDPGLFRVIDLGYRVASGVLLLVRATHDPGASDRRPASHPAEFSSHRSGILSNQRRFAFGEVHRLVNEMEPGVNKCPRRRSPRPSPGQFRAQFDWQTVRFKRPRARRSCGFH